MMAACLQHLLFSIYKNTVGLPQGMSPNQIAKNKGEKAGYGIIAHAHTCTYVVICALAGRRAEVLRVYCNVMS